MTQATRLPEIWFRRGLWLLALLFAWFLIGLGGLLVGDLPKVERKLTPADFTDPQRVTQLNAQIKDAHAQQATAQEALAQAQLRHQSALADLLTERQSLANWQATRSVTQQSNQDPEVLQRTHRVDLRQQAERKAEAEVQSRQKTLLDAQQREAGLRRDLAAHETTAREQWKSEFRSLELRVFLYRLALTLPLVVVAAWLLRRHRHARWWPFVWGFGFFAGYVFFFELVPYLPSYGDYIRYGVGVVLTVVVGWQAIQALERYLQRQREAEALPDKLRRQELSYDTALARLDKGVCPGCERAVPLKAGAGDFCPHCGIGLFNHCSACRTHKSAFSRFCPGCGVAADARPPSSPAASPDPAARPA